MKKKIAIISPSLKMGGIERALTVIANEWASIGLDVTYISCLRSVPFYNLDSKIKFLEPNFKRSGGLLNKILFYPRLLIFLRSNTIKTNPDRVLVYGDWFSPIALLALFNTRYAVYISDRTIPNYKFKFPIPQLKKWLYPNSAGFIAQTRQSKKFKEKLFGSRLRIQIIPNALPEFSNEITNVAKLENKIIYVGRFAWEKDPEILIRTMAMISIKHPAWKLYMAGTGPLLEPMKNLVKELKLDSKVIFLENVNNVGQLYQEATMLILPSVIEGFPNTLIEAMSFGLPCICFQDIPYEDIVTDQVDGIVVKERTTELLAASIDSLIINKELRMQIGKNAKESVRRYDKEKIALQLLDFMKI